MILHREPNGTHHYVLTHDEERILRSGLTSDGIATLTVTDEDGEHLAIFDSVAPKRTSKPPMVVHAPMGEL